MRRHLEIKLEKLTERVMRENELNQMLFKASVGKEVSYGTEVFLQHADSEAFIKGTNDCTTGSKLGYDCRLSNIPSPSMAFKILPRFKSRQEGEVIQYGNLIVFQCSQYQSYLSFATDIKLPTDVDYEMIKREDHNPFRFEQYVCGSSFSRLKIYLNQESDTPWKVTLFKSGSKDRSTLYGCDLVRLKHTELEGDITAGLAYKHNQPEAYIINSINGGFFRGFRSVWEIEHTTLTERGGCFPIEKVDSEDIGAEYLSSMFRLRHVASGKLLHRTSHDAKKPKLFLANIPKATDFIIDVDNDATLSYYTSFRAFPVLSNLNELQSNTSYHVIVEEPDSSLRQGFYVKAAKDINLSRTDILTRSQGELKRLQNENQFQPLLDIELGVSRRTLLIEHGYSSQDAFTIEKLTEGEKHDILVVRSALCILKDIAYRLYTGRPVTRENLYQVQECLLYLCSFVLGLPTDKDWKIDELEGTPLHQRQQLLLDMQLIDILIDIVRWFLSGSTKSMPSPYMASTISKSISDTYAAIRLGIQEYRPAELYASQWLDFFMDQSLSYGYSEDMGASKTLTELLDNNKKVIETRVNESIIQRFLKAVDTDSAKQAVKHLRAVVICHEKPLMFTQNLIIRCLLKTGSGIRQIVYPIRSFDKGIEIQIPKLGGKWVQLKEERSKLNSEEIYCIDYFCEVLHLFADLATSQDTSIVEALQPMFPFERCVEMVTDESYQISLKTAALRLSQHLWVEIAFGIKQELPINVRSLIEPATGLCRPENIEQSQKFAKLKSYMTEFLMKLDESTKNTADELKDTSSILEVQLGLLLYDIVY